MREPSTEPLGTRLRDLLLPGELFASLPGAPESGGWVGSARYRIWYRVGPRGAGLIDDRDAEGTDWNSIPPGTSEGEAPLRELAERLWMPEGGRGLPDRIERLLAVADPISNAITLAWRVRPGAEILEPHPAAEATPQQAPAPQVRNLVSDQVETFLSETRHYESRLVRRPSLHLALVGPGPLPGRLRREIEQVLRPLGLYLADFQVRWLNEKLIAGEDLLRELLLLHQPWPLWPAPEHSIDRETVESVEGQLEKLAEAIDSHEAALRGRPFSALIAVEDLITRVPTLSPPSRGLPGGQDHPPDETLIEAPRSVMVELQLRARQWLEQPLHLPLAPMTLVAGVNGSGKTTLAEALSLAFSGLPRPRLMAPERADQWQAGGVAASGSRPRLDLLRLRLEEPSTAASGGDLSGASSLAARELLPLFADDSDLPGGVPGDLAVVTWLPFPGLRSPGVAGGAAGAGIAQRFVWIATRLRAIFSKPRNGVMPKKANSIAPGGKAGDPDVKVPGWFLEALRLALDQIESGMASGQNADKGDSAKKLEIVRENQRRVARRRTRVPLDLVRDYQEELAEQISDRAELSQDHDWQALGRVDNDLGGGTAFSRLAERKFEASWRRLEAGLGEFSEQLANALFAAQRFEEEVDRYLAGTIDPRQEQRVRPSTAGLVRIGQAKRLARWLSCGGVDWPFLVVDEPTLGQDDASCARTLVRYLRLLRKVESARWWNHRWGASPAPQLGSVEFLGLDDLEAWPQKRLQTAGAGGGGFQSVVDPSGEPPSAELPELPFAPQILALSYREPALSVVAVLEGAVLDDRLAATLRELLPKEWWGDLQDSLRRAVERYRRFRDAQEGVPSLPMPPVLVRRYWEPPIEKTVSRTDSLGKWSKDAPRALRRLGLGGIATEVVAELGAKTDPAVVAWRLLAWLLAADLLPATMADGEICFTLSGVSFRSLSPFGGEPREQGPALLRRVVPCMDCLPRLPSRWKEQVETGLKRRSTPAGSAQAEILDVASASELEAPGTGLGAPPAPEPAAPEPPVVSVSGEVGARVVIRFDLRSSPARWSIEEARAGETASDPLADDLDRLRQELRWAGFEKHVTLETGDSTIVWEGRKPEFGAPVYRWSRAVNGGAPREARWQAFEGAAESLLEALLKERTSLVAADVRSAKRFVQVVLASYNRSETPTAPIDFRLTADPLASELRLDPGDRQPPSHWETIFGRGLLRLRTQLATSLETRAVRFFPRCNLATAVRAGAVFHRVSGFQVQCHQGDEIWDLGKAAPTAEGLELEDRTVDAGGGEVHCLVSVSQSVLPAYEAWRSSSGLGSATVLHFSPGSPSRDSIRDGALATAWAGYIFRAMKAHQQDASQPLRLFLAAPAALALALGRELNAAGRVIAMDWHKETSRYYVAFDFSAG